MQLLQVTKPLKMPDLLMIITLIKQELVSSGEQELRLETFQEELFIMQKVMEPKIQSVFYS